MDDILIVLLDMFKNNYTSKDQVETIYKNKRDHEILDLLETV